MSEAALARCVDLLDRIYARHAAGCCLHIVTDDGNVRDRDVIFCFNLALQNCHDDCLEAAWILATFSKTRRRKVTRCRL